MSTPKRRSLFARLLAGLAWLVGRRAPRPEPSDEPTPAPAATAPAATLDSAYQLITPASLPPLGVVVTSTYDHAGNLIRVENGRQRGGDLA